MPRPADEARSPLARAFPDGNRLRVSTLRELQRNHSGYVVFFMARSGSSWLTELAMNGGRLGTPHEWFNRGFVVRDGPVLGCKPPKLLGTTDINDYVREIAATYGSKDGIIGVQLSHDQTLALLGALEKDAPIPTVPMVFLRRKNLIAQSISSYRSVESGLWHSFQRTEAASHAMPPYCAETLVAWASHIVDTELLFEKLFRRLKVRPRRFFYEDLIGDPLGVLRWLESMIVGGSSNPIEALPATTLTRLADHESRDWERRLRSERSDALAGIDARRPGLFSDFSGS